MRVFLTLAISIALLGTFAQTANADGGSDSARQLTLAAEAEDHDENMPVAAAAGPAVIAETKMEISHLSVSEAVMRMELADHPVMMFRDVNSGVLNVVYRRPDGHIGWIDPGV